MTVDAAGACDQVGQRRGTAWILLAERSNAVLARIVADTVEAAGLPAGSVTLIAGGGRADLAELARQDRHVDLIIPGGGGLKAALQDSATVPVIFAAAGNCHVYVDSATDVAMAPDRLQREGQRPGVCNAAEPAGHADLAAAVLPGLLENCAGGVEMPRRRARALAP